MFGFFIEEPTPYSLSLSAWLKKDSITYLMDLRLHFVLFLLTFLDFPFGLFKSSVSTLPCSHNNS